MMELTFRKGTVADTQQYIRFLNEVKADMQEQSWFYLDPPELVQTMMADGTMELWLAMDGERIAAAFDILHPGLEPYNYGYDLDLTSEELLRVIHMDTAAVHPDYRGMGLQRKMVRIVEEVLKEKGEQILLCTVHPENKYSLNNMIQQGYEVRKRLEKYGSERFILRKNIF